MGCCRFDHEREPSAALASEKVLHRYFKGATGDKLLHGGPVSGSGEVGKVVSKLVLSPGGMNEGTCRTICTSHCCDQIIYAFSYEEPVIKVTVVSASAHVVVYAIAHKQATSA